MSRPIPADDHPGFQALKARLIAEAKEIRASAHRANEQQRTELRLTGAQVDAFARPFVRRHFKTARKSYGLNDCFVNLTRQYA